MPTKPDLIVFLCPNGHRLNGPASLEGKPGQCPHCGVKFRVPSRDDPPEEDDAPPSTTGPGSGSGIQAIDTVEEIPGEEPTFNIHIDELAGSSPSRATSSSASSKSSTSAAAPAGSRSELGEIFAKLWSERERGSVVELHLANGQMLLPERFAKDSARRGYGLFALKDPEGTYSVTAIAWDAIARVNVRHLVKLPKKVFD